MDRYMKCIVFTRVSTSRQEVDSQKIETIEYAKSLDFDEFKIISRTGASAYKLTSEYLQMVDEMKQAILSDRSIKAVVCFHLNRLCRNDVIAMDIKQFLINNNVNLYIKEPTIKLLNDDGSVNSGAELAFSLFATMNKQQISELRAKVKRAKARDKAIHKYIGGPVVAFGYRVNTDNMVVVNEKQAEIIRTIFELYGTGEWSYTTLDREIKERYGLELGWWQIGRILKNPNYWNNSMYPPIITELDYQKAEKQRKSCTSRPTQSKHFHFANRIIKCPKCGRGLTGNVRDYRCRLGCDAPRIGIPALDGLLWLIASHLEGERMLNTDTKEELRQKKAVLAAKIESVGNYTSKGEKRAERAKKMALEGLIEVEEYKAILKDVENEQKETLKKVDGWKAELAELDRLIVEDTKSMERILTIADKIDSSDEQEMRTIVRRWITKVTYTKDWIFIIETIGGRVYRCRYNRYGFESRWWTINNKPIAARPLKRSETECTFGKNRCKPNDLITTLAWLTGSEIV